MEHVVATELRRRRSRVVVGEEPIAGIVIERLLGEGAHGRVFLARRQPGNERVVVKEIIVDVDHVNATRRRFLAESRALARVVHLNVVRLIDAHVTEGKYLLLMEHVAGRSLTEELAAGAMDEARTRSILRDVLDGLAAAHLQGVLHRDVKPSNVLIRENGSAVLTDFSIAATGPLAADIRSTVSNLDALGTLTGTLAYLAPECARGVPASEASDLYAVGLVAYEALAGRPAIDLRGLTLGAALARAERPSIELAAVPDGWREFFARALHVDPARRYANAAEMRNSLEDGSNR